MTTFIHPDHPYTGDYPLIPDPMTTYPWDGHIYISTVRRYKYCPECGKKANEDWKHCPDCGTYLYEAYCPPVYPTVNYSVIWWSINLCQ